MLDPKLLRQDFDVIAAMTRHRGIEINKAKFTALEARRAELQTETQQLQALRNQNAKAVGRAKANGEDASAILAESNDIAAKLADKEQILAEIQQQLLEIQLTIPNLVHDSVPVGKSENDNVLVRTWGEPRAFDFEVKDHVALGEGLEQMDFARAARISGSRFVADNAASCGALEMLHNYYKRKSHDRSAVQAPTPQCHKSLQLRILYHPNTMP